MELVKFVRQIDASIVSGQDAKTKEWYCKELPTKTVRETKKKIGQLNKIYNEYNNLKEEAEEEKRGKG